jgi:hypothetical protein
MGAARHNTTIGHHDNCSEDAKIIRRELCADKDTMDTTSSNVIYAIDLGYLERSRARSHIRRVKKHPMFVSAFALWMLCMQSLLDSFD